MLHYFERAELNAIISEPRSAAPESNNKPGERRYRERKVRPVVVCMENALRSLRLRDTRNRITR